MKITNLLNGVYKIDAKFDKFTQNFTLKRDFFLKKFTILSKITIL